MGHGGDNRDRTGNPQLAKLVLSQLSYIPDSFEYILLPFTTRHFVPRVQGIHHSQKFQWLCHEPEQKFNKIFASGSWWAEQESHL